MCVFNFYCMDYNLTNFYKYAITNKEDITLFSIFIEHPSYTMQLIYLFYKDIHVLTAHVSGSEFTTMTPGDGHVSAQIWKPTTVPLLRLFTNCKPAKRIYYILYIVCQFLKPPCKEQDKSSDIEQQSAFWRPKI